jgi:hypothetical protein
VSTTTVEVAGPATRQLAAGFVVAAGAWALSPVHPQLVCPFRAVTGLPCPFCGMTRSVDAAVHGQMMASLRFQPAGIFLLVAVAWVLLRRSRATIRLPAWTLFAVLAAMWLWNLTLNPTFH